MKDVVVSQVNPVDEKQINEETVNVKEASNDANSEQSLFEDSGKEAEPEKEVESHQLRLQLHLPIPSRSQSLDSPVDTPEIVYPPLNIPETVSENDAVSSVREESPLPPEFPPSPMVSHGKTIYSAMSSQGTGIPLLDSEFSLEENEKEPVMSLLRSVSKEQPSTSSMGDNSKSDNNNSGKLTPSQSPKRSPTSRRKFTISRVEEPGVVHSNSPSPTQVVVLGDPLGAISGVDINTLSIKPQAKHNLSSDSTNSDKIREVNKTVNDNVVKELQQNITDEITDAIVSVNLNLKSPVLVEYTEASSTNRNISDSNCEVENTGIKDDVHISNNDASCLKTGDPVLATSQSKSESYIESSSLNEPYVIFPTHESNNTKMTDSKNNEITNSSKDNSSAIENSCDQLKQSVSDVDHRSGVGEHSRSSLVEMGASASGSVSCNDSANIVSLNGVTIDVNDLLEGADVPDMQIGEGDSASSSLGMYILLLYYSGCCRLLFGPLT